MKSKMFTFFILIMAGFSCRKSNYVSPVSPTLPDSLLNWKVVSTLSGQNLSDIWFTSESRGFALADGIYESNDGGTSWSAVPNTYGTGKFLNLFFVNAQFGIAQGSTVMAVTNDGGNSWSIKTMPTGRGWTLFFVDPSTGFYGDVGASGLEKTTDTGNTWVSVFSDPGSAACCYPFFLNSDTGFVASGSGTFATTLDGGQSWQTTNKILPENPTGFTAYNQLFFLDKDNGFYAYPSGILKTIDGGQSWQNVLPATVDATSPANVIKFVNMLTGYYKGMSAIYKTSDGGQTWSISCKLGSDQFIGMYFLDEHVGWACTAQGRVLKIQQ